MRDSVKNHIEQHKIIVIMRNIYGEKALQLCDALYRGGIRLVEVTFDQSSANCVEKTPDTIRLLNEKMGDKMDFGAGTVITPEQVVAAKNAGARYIISPNTSERIIAITRELGLVSMPGAMTPSEMIAADQAGADFVKVFPAGDLGLSYMKNVRAPISHVKFIATGGVNESNFADYLHAGFVGAGISGRLTDRALLDIGDYDGLTKRAEDFVKIVSEAKVV